MVLRMKMFPPEMEIGRRAQLAQHEKNDEQGPESLRLRR